MTLFHRNQRNYGTSSSSRRTTQHRFYRKDPNRVAAGYKAALSNPNTTREGRREAKQELRMMGRRDETHVPFMTKVKRALGIRSTPRRRRENEMRYDRRRRY